MTAHRTAGPPRFLHRRGLLACMAAAVLLPRGAAAADLLKTPAFHSRRAATALLLGAAAAGRRIVAVGERGIAILSDDGGRTWRQAAVPVSVTLTAVHFVTESTGWAVGHDGVVLRSGDGGERWTPVFDGTAANALVVADARGRLEEAKAGGDADALADAELAMEDAQAAAEFGPSRPLLGVWFADADTGFAVGSYGQIFHTRDGGGRWVSLGRCVANPNGLHYNAIAGQPDGTLLMAGEGGCVYRSRNGGADWETLETGAPTNLYGVDVLDGALVAYGFGGRIFRSAGGEAWEPVESPTARSLVGAVRRDGALILVDAAGALISTRDAGRTFALLAPPGRAAVAGALAVDGGVLTVGAGGARILPLPA